MGTAFGTSSILALGGSPLEPVLVVRGLKTEFSTTRGTLRAVDGVDLEINKGEVLGLVGESGCGKSVTALSIMYLIPEPPGRIAAGEVWFQGKNLLAGSEEEIRLRPRRRGPPKFVPDAGQLKRHQARMNKVRGRSMSMIFQEPMSSLNPVLRVGYQVAEVLMYQRRREICESLLARHSLTKEDLDVFRKAVATADAPEREFLVADFCVRTGLRPEKVNDIIEVPGLSVDDRIARIEVLARRRRLGNPRWLRFLLRTDALDESHFARQWDKLSRRSLARPIIELLDPVKNPIAKGLPPLARITPVEGTLRLYLRRTDSADRAARFVTPTEELRAQVEAVFRDTTITLWAAVLELIEKVALGKDSIEVRLRPLAKVPLKSEIEYWLRRFVFRFLISVPGLRTYLMRPIEGEARRRVIGLLRLVRIPEPTKIYNEYPHELSGGMQQRVMIAMALAGDPALMIADEPTTSLDVTTQAQILGLIRDLRKRIDAAILYITHDLAVIAELSDRVAVMYAGKVVEDAPVKELFANPLHPYTQGLLESIVSTGNSTIEPGAPLPTIPGVVPDLLSPPSGCRFHPRCKFAFDRCRAEEPKLLSQGPNQKVACHLYDKEGARAAAG